MLQAWLKRISDAVANAGPRTRAVLAISALVLAARVLQTRRRRANASRSLRRRATSIGTTRLLAGDPYGWSRYDSIINAVVTLEGRLDVAALVSVLQSRLVHYTRFRAVPVQTTPCGEIFWAARPVDPAAHVFTAAVGGPPGSAASADAIDAIANTLLLTKERPWWEIHVLRHSEGVQPSAKGPNGAAVEGEATTVVFRIHHCLGDGLSLSEVFLDMLVDATGGSVAVQSVPTAGGGSRGGGNTRGARTPLWRYPLLLVDAVACALRVLALPIVGRDTPTAFSNPAHSVPVCANRTAVYLPSHSIALVNRLRSAIGPGVTINDLEYALFAGAVRRFLSHHGEDPDAVSLRAVTPFAVPEAADATTRYDTLLRNHWTFVCNPLPVAGGDAVARIRASHALWTRVKMSMVIPVNFAVHRLASRLPASQQHNTAIQVGTRTSCIFSNVAGPPGPVFLAGCRLTALHMLYPNIGPQVGILSSGGMLHAVVMAASGPVSPRLLARCWMEELEAAAKGLGIPESDVAAGVDRRFVRSWEE